MRAPRRIRRRTGRAPAGRGTSRRRRCGAATEQHVGPSGADAEEPGAQGDLARQVEGRRRRAASRSVISPTASRRISSGPRPGEDPLRRQAVGLGEHGAQALVPGDHVAQRACRASASSGPRRPQRQRDVVGGARSLEPVQEPQAILRRRERQPPGAPARARPRPGRGGVQAVGQACHRRCLEHGPDIELHPNEARSARKAHRRERVAPEREEVVVDADAAAGQDLGEQAADGISSTGVAAAARRRWGDRERAGRACRPCRWASGGGARARRRRPHHVVRQLRRELMPQCRRIEPGSVSAAAGAGTT
jgi:hypothetical protein